MNAAERVLAACAFQTTDRVPRVEFFWDYPAEWSRRLGPIEAVNDVVILAPNEGPFPSRARHLRTNERYRYEIDAWGRVVRRREGAFFVETLETVFADPTRIESEAFEPPSQEARYARLGVETVEDLLSAGGSARSDSGGCGRKKVERASLPVWQSRWAIPSLDLLAGRNSIPDRHCPGLRPGAGHR